MNAEQQAEATVANRLNVLAAVTSDIIVRLKDLDVRLGSGPPPDCTPKTIAGSGVPAGVPPVMVSVGELEANIAETQKRLMALAASIG